MVQVKADDAMISILGPLTERAEVLDTQGKLVGYFTPLDDEEALYRHAATLFDPEEVRESLAAGGSGSTIDEILQRLRSSGSA